MAQLQPLVFGLAEELLAVSVEQKATRLQAVLDSLTEQVSLGAEPQVRHSEVLSCRDFLLVAQTQQFVHALKDELVKSALLEIHDQRGSSSHVHSNGLFCDNTPANQEGRASPGQQDAEYDEEEWASGRLSRCLLWCVRVFHVCVFV